MNLFTTNKSDDANGDLNEEDDDDDAKELINTHTDKLFKLRLVD